MDHASIFNWTIKTLRKEGVKLKVEKKMAELNIELPSPPAPIASYVPYTKVGDLIYVSGQGPGLNGKNKYFGKVGRDLTKEQGYEAARRCCLNVLAHLKEAAGDLDRIERIVSLHGYVNSTEEFSEQPFVINGASDLLVAVFGSVEGILDVPYPVVVCLTILRWKLR